jgi:ferrous iron transport protein A
MAATDQDTIIPLSLLPNDSWGEIVAVEIMGPVKRRLLDLGLVPGTKIQFAFSSPLGDPRAYRVRGTLLALRANEAQSIMVRRSEQ